MAPARGCVRSRPRRTPHNAFALHDEIVINEIMFDHPSATLLAPGAPQPATMDRVVSTSQACAVDLSGWRLNGGVEFAFPAGSRSCCRWLSHHRGKSRGGDCRPRLAGGEGLRPVVGQICPHGSDRIVLEDAAGNPADDVRFFSEGRWPVAANAGGSSLELRDPDADNNVAESWAASDESGKAAWQTFTWSGPNVAVAGGRADTVAGTGAPARRRPGRVPRR